MRRQSSACNLRRPPNWTRCSRRCWIGRSGGSCDMGHTRLGTIPKTRKWRQLVALIANGQGDDAGLSHHVERIVAQTLSLTEAGLESAINDKGLRFTFYLL